MPAKKKDISLLIDGLKQLYPEHIIVTLRRLSAEPVLLSRNVDSVSEMVFLGFLRTQHSILPS